MIAFILLAHESVFHAVLRMKVFFILFSAGNAVHEKFLLKRQKKQERKTWE